MRVVFSAMTSKTHFYPLVPLAWAFKAAGHEVRVVGLPGLTDVITSSGLTAVPVGSDVELSAHMDTVGEDMIRFVRTLDFSTGPKSADWEHLYGMQTVLTPNLYALMTPDSLIDGMVEYCRAWRPDLLIWEPLTFAAPVAARVTGAAHARLLWGPDITTRARRNFLELMRQRPEEDHDDPFAEWIDWTLRRHGVRPGPVFDETMAEGQWTIDPMPKGMRLDLDLPTVGMRYVPYNGPSVVPEWLHTEPERPRVCITLGISGRDSGVGLVSIDEIMGAIAEIDAEFVATFNAEQLETVSRVPDNVRVVDFVPMHALLPTCTAVVHHGGPGTWHAAAINGVPQVILPNGWDTDVRAARTEELGAGLALPVPELTIDLLRDGLLRVLAEPDFRVGAERVRAEMAAEPSPAEIVPVLEKLAAEHAG